jgi:hypothetical protein
LWVRLDERAPRVAALRTVETATAGKARTTNWRAPDGGIRAMEVEGPAGTPPLAWVGGGGQSRHFLPTVGHRHLGGAAGRLLEGGLPDVGNPLPAHLQTVCLSGALFRQEN